MNETELTPEEVYNWCFPYECEISGGASQLVGFRSKTTKFCLDGTIRVGKKIKGQWFVRSQGRNSKAWRAKPWKSCDVAYLDGLLTRMMAHQTEYLRKRLDEFAWKILGKEPRKTVYVFTGVGDDDTLEYVRIDLRVEDGRPVTSISGDCLYRQEDELKELAREGERVLREEASDGVDKQFWRLHQRVMGHWQMIHTIRKLLLNAIQKRLPKNVANTRTSQENFQNMAVVKVNKSVYYMSLRLDCVPYSDPSPWGWEILAIDRESETNVIHVDLTQKSL